MHIVWLLSYWCTCIIDIEYWYKFQRYVNCKITCSNWVLHNVAIYHVEHIIPFSSDCAYQLTESISKWNQAYATWPGLVSLNSTCCPLLPSPLPQPSSLCSAELAHSFIRLKGLAGKCLRLAALSLCANLLLFWRNRRTRSNTHTHTQAPAHTPLAGAKKWQRKRRGK